MILFITALLPIALANEGASAQPEPAKVKSATKRKTNLYYGAQASVLAPIGQLEFVESLNLHLGYRKERSYSLGGRLMFVNGADQFAILDAEQAVGAASDFRLHIKSVKDFHFYPVLSTGFLVNRSPTDGFEALPLFDMAIGTRYDFSKQFNVALETGMSNFNTLYVGVTLGGG